MFAFGGEADLELNCCDVADWPPGAQCAVSSWAQWVPSRGSNRTDVRL